MRSRQTRLRTTPWLVLAWPLTELAIRRARGAAGAGLFALIDEWFKKNWIVTDFEYPPDRKRLWLNPLDAEENHGVVAMRAGSKGSKITIDGDNADWRGRPRAVCRCWVSFERPGGASTQIAARRAG